VRVLVRVIPPLPASWRPKKNLQVGADWAGLTLVGLDGALLPSFGTHLTGMERMRAKDPMVHQSG
jgi:hypothetical protein